MSFQREVDKEGNSTHEHFASPEQDAAMNIDHVLLTRFNLPSLGVESLVRAQEGWLRDRQILFEKYCLPAVRSQSIKNFQWIIYFDTQSPKWLKLRIAELARDGDFIAIYRDEVPHATLLEDLRRVTGASREGLLTTNLDNDDGIASDFVERLQKAVQNQSRTAIYVVNGLIQQGNRLYLRRDKVNAFCSVSESWTSPVTCWSDWHTKLGEKMKVLEVGGTPGWLQVIHTGNVSNRVRGRRVGPGLFRDIFAVGMADALEPRSLELAMDRLVLNPARATKDALRVVAKNVVLAFGGKGGLERLKVIVAKNKRVEDQSNSGRGINAG
ncbi:glycosyltransferase [Arthrobacter sp. TMP15]|uniref:glycosyltransferase n=1 Tax=Arthrobacter sp. TMP15 TaxID=3140789 RepID=UPI0031BB388D